MDVALAFVGCCFSDVWMLLWRCVDVALAIFGRCFSDLWMLLSGCLDVVVGDLCFVVSAPRHKAGKTLPELKRELRPRLASA